ncbi:MAG: hypothetical protein KJ067_18300 [Vicinamibacteria bacterium]|nr:hypothetical protein [Vicinamibacteria bacterium]
MRVEELSHLLKRGVLGHRRVHGLLRRLLVTPYQIMQLRRIDRLMPAPAPPADAPRVLVLALRHWAISRAWEAVLGRLLAREGCRVTWLECGRAVSRCDGMRLGPAPAELCAHCCDFNRRAAAALGVERRELSEWLPAPGAGGDEAARATAVRSSLQRMLGALPPPLTREDGDQREARVELEHSAELVQRLAGRVLDELAPRAILMLNGKLYAERLFLDAARERGIAAWCYERGNRRDTLVVSRDRPAIPFDTRHIVATLRERPLTGDERRRIETYLGARADLGNGQVRYLPRNGGGLPGGRQGAERVYSLFTNLIWDSAVVGEDLLFADMFEWIAETVRALAEVPGTRLAIRVHPAETKVYWHPTRETVEARLREAFPRGLPANVVLIGPGDPVDSYALVAESDVVLVFASSIGMEAAAQGKRVVVAGRSGFHTAPFVVRPEDRAAYREELASGRTEPATPDAPELALRFMDRLYFEEMLPVPVVAEDPTGFHARESGPDEAALANRLRLFLREAGILPARPA